MLNFVICDDNIHMLNRLSLLFEKVFMKNNFDAQIVFKTTDYNELISFVSNNQVAVVVLDIEFTGSNVNGLDIANKIREFNKNCYLIFITSHFEYIMQAYKYKTFDYLIKNAITDETLTNTLKRLFDDISSPSNNFLRIDNKGTFVGLNDIQFIEKSGVRIIYHAFKKDLVTYNSFNKIVLPNNFVRCHRSFIANVNNISNISLSTNSILFKNGSVCYIGPKYKSSFMEAINYEAVSK